MLNTVSAAINGSQHAILNAAKGILLDWDGCIAIENRVLPLARVLFAQHADRLAIVSNNSTHLPGDFAELLAQQGVHFRQERIFLAGAETVREIAAERAARVLLFAVPRMRAYARELGIRLVRRDPDIVLLMRDVNFSYRKLEIAANAVRSGARLVVANADASHPGPGGSVVPETGALLAALQACLGTADPAEQIVGKPGPLLFERACAGLGVSPAEALMIGDNPDTDGEGARRAGMRSIIIGGATSLRLEHLVHAGEG